MSIVFSESTNKTGICEIIDDAVGSNSTNYSLYKKARDINLGIDNLLLILFGAGAGGSWELDDSNQTDYPIITTNLVSGQRDYSFVSDGSGNLVLDIYKVQVMDTNGVYHDIYPVDQQRPTTFPGDTQNIASGIAPSTMGDGQNSTGTPTCYDKTGNGIFLDLIPSYNKTNGLRVFINRESTYFTGTDTTKKWGYTGIWHEYLLLYACYQYARAKILINRNEIKRDLLEKEANIKKHLGQRQRDVVARFIPRVQNNR